MHNNIVLIGMPGCGKSEIGKQLAGKLGMQFIDIDEYIETTFGQIPDLFKLGEAHFRNIESEAVATISQFHDSVISTGGGVILREENIRILKATGTILFIDRPLELLLSEVDTSHRPLLAEGRHKMINLHEQRIALYRKYADIIIDNSGELDTTLNCIISALKEAGK